MRTISRSSLATLLSCAAVPLSCAQGPPQPPPQSCASGAVYTGAGVTYDLTRFSTDYGFRVRDLHNNTADADFPGFNCDIVYWFSVCNDMDPPSSSVTNASVCATTTGADGTVQTGPGPAWKLVNGGCNPGCVRLGGPSATSGFLAPMYDVNPARGVMLFYTGGDTCQVTGAGGVTLTYQRSVRLDFTCFPKGSYLPQYNEVYEDVRCIYHVLIYSPLGCPTQCPQGRNSPFLLCSGHGICNYDTSQSAARCFCNKGYSGAACDQGGDKGLPPPPNYGGSIAGALFGGIAGGIIVVLVVFAVRAYMTQQSFVDTLKLSFAGFGGGGHTAVPTTDMNAAYVTPTFEGTASSGQTYAPPVAEHGAPYTGNAFAASGDGPLLA